MGTFSYPFALGPKDGPMVEEVEGLVDTSSTYTVAPAPLLQRLGIVPQWSGVFELADGRQEEYGMAEVRVLLNASRADHHLHIWGARLPDLLGSLHFGRVWPSRRPGQRPISAFQPVSDMMDND